MPTPPAELERELRRLAFVEHRRLLGSLTPAARTVLAMRLNPVTQARVRTADSVRAGSSGGLATSPAQQDA